MTRLRDDNHYLWDQEPMRYGLPIPVEKWPYEDWDVEDLLPEVMEDTPFEPKPIRKRATREHKLKEFRHGARTKKKRGRACVICGDQNCEICRQTVKRDLHKAEARKKMRDYLMEEL
jgi:hypothetical protein